MSDTRSKLTVLLAVDAVIMIMIGAAAVVAVKGTERRAAVPTRSIARLCLASKMAMHDDRLAFESGDPRRQEEALARFYEGQALYHSSASLVYCIPEEKLPELPIGCWLGKDWKCLAAIAATIEAELP